MESNVFPGIYKKVNLESFSDEEAQIVKKLSREWYVTNGGETIKLGSSLYRYILVKPVHQFQEMFNLEREIITIFSDYNNFEPRTLDAVDYISKKHQSLRIDKICSIIISKDTRIASKLRDILRADQESQILIPFSFDELLKNYDEYFIRNRFKEHFYTRDLFAFQSPLKKDLYFFGRNDLIHNIVNRHKSNENSGLFGLRKTGKTSVLFGIQRTLLQQDSKSLIIDCQSPAFHRRRWNKALYYICLRLQQEFNLDLLLEKEEHFTEEDAPLLFEKNLLNIYNALGKQRFLLIFDEIENITFNISPSEHWSTGLDFVFLWQTLRSVFQRTSIFSYLIVGTNSTCIESSTINGKDNPIFNQVPFEYIPSFDVPQTREMVRKLGRLMGLKFDETIYSKLTEDFGVHPFLVRYVCSIINSLCPLERSTSVDRLLYEQAKEIFRERYNNYVEMILNVLKEFYEDEYSMLEYLARGDIETFQELANFDPYYTNHLLGYGIIEKRRDTYLFKIEAVKDYIAKRQKYNKVQLTQDEMRQEISERRNTLEPKLRHIIRNQLRANFGKAKAKDIVLDMLGEPRKTELNKLSYEDLFNPNIAQIYFEDLRKIVAKYWDTFRHIFIKGQEDFNLELIRKPRDERCTENK